MDVSDGLVLVFIVGIVFFKLSQYLFGFRYFSIVLY